MALSVLHTFASVVPDGPDPDEVQPSHWNAEHTLAVSAAAILGATAAGPVAQLTQSQARSVLGLVPGTDVQAWDALLASIAGLTFGADSYIYGTASDTAAAGTITSFGRSLVDDAAASNARTTLGLVIGTDVQAYDADLAALAANSSDGLWAHTGAGTGAARTLTAPAAGLTISNPAGVAGNPTFALADDLAALEALTGTDTIYRRSGVSTWAAITIGSLLSFSGGTLDVGDAELVALAGLTSAADKLPYFTGLGAAALADFTAFGRSLVDDAAAVNGRSTLGVVIGTDVQAFDATLLSIAALGTAADRIAYTTGIDTWAETPLTSFGRSLIDDAADSNARTTLGLVIGTNVQAWDADLDTIAGLAKTDGNFIVADGAAWTVESGATARASLGLTIGTDVQAFDATLLSIAALGTAADRIAYTTGVDTWAETPLTAFGRSLIDDAAASNARTTLGLAIGTDVQAYDADLAALAGLTSAADKVPYFTGSAAAAVADFTSAGRSMVGAANAAAQTALLSNFVGDSGSGGTKGLVPAPAAGDAAASKFLKADGAWTTPAGAGDVTSASNFGTDNVLIRSDGTGKGVQSTGVTVGDSNDVSGIRSIALPTIPTQGYDAVTNLNLVVSAAAGALTIAIKGVDGNDPSATNAIDIPFRSATATEGKPVWRTLSAASSLVLPSGAEFGVVANTAFRLAVGIFDDGGTLRPAAINATQVGLDEGIVASSTTIGTGSDSASVWYSGTGATSKSFRLLGYIDFVAGIATPGTWTAPTYVQLMGPGINIQPAPFTSVLTSGTAATYTTPVGATRLEVELIGGGGGGGGGANATFFTGGGGGGGGGYVRHTYYRPVSTYTYTIGAAGTAGTAGSPGTTGGTGGNTTWVPATGAGATLTGSGGVGGTGGAAAGIGGYGGIGGAAANGTRNMPGNDGSSGGPGVSGLVGGPGGSGGAGLHGGAGAGGLNTGGQAAEANSGAGGGAGSNGNGGAGGTGVVIVTAYFN